MSRVIPVERLWELYDYNPLAGTLISKRTAQPLRGSIHPKGYKHFCLWYDGQNIKLLHSRAVYAWCTGAWPIYQIDHIDRNRTNDRIQNLRDVSNRENIQNTSSFNGGATYLKRRHKWISRIRVNGKHKYLGCFGTKEEAQAAYAAALSELVS